MNPMGTLRHFRWVVFSAILSALTAGAAHAQNVDLELRTKEGCRLYLPAVNPSVKDAYLARFDNYRCENGLVEGPVFFGIGFTLTAPNQPDLSVIGMRGGVMRAGRFEGLRLNVLQGGVAFLIAPPNNKRFERERAGYAIDDVLAGIDELYLAAGGSRPQLNRDYLKDMARLWDARPYDMMREQTAHLQCFMI